MRKGNIYADIVDHAPEETRKAPEILQTLVQSGGVRVERIISEAHASPEGFWYDQSEGEWVLLIKGGAGLRFEGESELLVLKPGDWVDIAAHVRHRVEWTDPNEKTVWLAVFY